MIDLFATLRLTWRGLLRHPGLLFAATLTLMLGIGANTAVFSVVRTVLLEPLPYAAPDRLYFVWNQFPAAGEFARPLSEPEYADWSAEQDIFAGLGAVTTGEQNFLWTLELDDGTTEKWNGAFASSNLFDVLGVPALRGRGFAPEDGEEGATDVIVLGYQFWQTRFDADPTILGQTIRVVGRDRVVVGVMPPGFHTEWNVTGARAADFWVPMYIDVTDNRAFRGMRTVARLRDGVSIEEATARVDIVAANMAAEYPEAYPAARGFTVALESVHKQIVGDVQTPLLVLMGTVTVILLIAAVNVTSLLLVRAESRQQETAVRVALGAGRLRLAQTFVLEGVMLSALGGAAGLLVATALISGFRRLNPGNIPMLDAVRLDWPMLGFTAVVVTLIGVLVGLVPTWQATRVDPAAGLRDGGRSATGGRNRQRLRSVLVTTEVALAVVLVTGAGLLMKSFRELMGTDLGIRTERVLSMRMEFPNWQYPDIEAVRNTHTALLDWVQELPGVSAASIAHAEHPLRLNGQWRFRAADEPLDPDDTRPAVGIRVVSPEHLETLGIPLRRGRFLDETDRSDAPLRIVINESLARGWFPDRDPIGERLAGFPPIPDEMTFEIVGVIGEVRNEGIRGRVRPTMLLPYTNAAFATGWQRYMSLLVRTPGDPTALTGTVRDAIRSVDPALTVSQIQTLDDVVAAQVAVPRFVAVILVAFGSLALILAALGIYGVISFLVTRRTQEIGLRMALGANRQRVILHVMRQGARLTATGIIAGVAISLLATRWLRSLLYEVSPTDITVFGGVILVLALATTVSCFLPARRASAIEPVQALRHE